MVPAMRLQHTIRIPRGQTASSWRPLGWMVWVLGALVLAGCASGPGRNAGTGGRTAPGVPPVVARSGPANSTERDGPPPAAEPLTKDVPLKERGLASWYGKKFHGRRTASGELFSMYGLTAAHRTLPIPSYARVTDVRTGKAVIVRVNDRGPFHSSRVMDLSYAAAVKLGIAARGSAEIEVERLTFEDIRTGAWQRDADLAPAQAASDAPVVAPAAVPVLPPAAPAQAPEPVVASATEALVSAVPTKAFTPFAKGFWVQLAALGKRDGVERLQQRVAAELQALQPMLAVYHEASLFKLQVGPYVSRDEAVAAAEQAREVLSVKPLVIERR
jgi:rare lipoprotein A